MFINNLNKLFFTFALALSFSFSIVAQEIEEVTVTATKKEESTQDLALSVEAYTATMLDNEQIYDASDLADVVPGFETGKSIGKGFAGNQKRHNFSRGPMTHGSKNHRLPGSIGAGSTPGRVYPGKKMAGRMGGQNVTLKNTEILYVNTEENILVVKGSVPGKKNTLLKIQPTKVV